MASRAYEYEVTAKIEFKDSFDWQTQADKWWDGDVKKMQDNLANFMIEFDRNADNWEGAEIPDDAVQWVEGPDWTDCSYRV